ncbi:MAG: bifunctional oligoribonuclease/PAP phosphatase NrnA [Gemmatimonadetes bacterium]|nr:bifunctional oligoribonuclease/PAP phosphatase NrnA [Gemmatimonadota bacterium]
MAKQRQDGAAVAEERPPEEDTGDVQKNGQNRAAELRDLLLARRGERHVVAVQDFPDPDAISSALAYREIAGNFDIHTDILYEGIISHPENLALVNLLEIDITRYSEKMALSGYDAAVFVDNQGATTRLTGRLKEAGVPTLAVIDHHDPTNLLEPLFSDVRPVGAAATLFVEYLRSGAVCELETANPNHVQLATALMHGLHSESDGFIRAGKAEYDAAAYLSSFIDTNLLEQVLCVQKSRATMDTIRTALARRSIRGGLSVAGIGYLRWADRDAIPQAADFLLTEENVNTAVVYGILREEDGREVVSGSLRTHNATLGVDSFLKRALGTDPRGRYYGGGRSRAGGFEIVIGFLAGGYDDREQLELKWKLYDAQVRRKFFYAAGLEEESVEEKNGALLTAAPGIPAAADGAARRAATAEGG